MCLPRHRKNIIEDQYLSRFFDETIQAINDRFVAHKDILRPFQYLLTTEANASVDTEDVQNLAVFYGFDDFNLKGQITLWKQFLKNLEPRPQSAIDALSVCNKNLFPTVYDLHTILSSLKLVKNYVRNSTGEERLNGLALMFVHPNCPVTEEEVLNKLALKPRRLNIAL